MADTPSPDDRSPSTGAALRGTGRDPGRRVTHPALIDDLTGLPNRLHFDVVFEVVFEIGDRGVPLSLVHFRVDDLEGYESDRGSDAARDAVRDFGRTIGGATRRTDLFARVGEDLYAALLIDCNLQGARVATDRLHDTLVDWTGETGLSFSAGLATWRQGMREPEDLWERAEEALAEARTRGGGQVS